MYCNIRIHEGISDMGKVICPFCEEQLQGRTAIYESCCNKQDIINENGKMVCQNCGKVDSYNTVDEYIDFYENKGKIIRKSVYHRKYHIQNIINNIPNHGIKISVHNSMKICLIFKEKKVLSQVNGNRKRMINTNFIMKKLFKMLNLPSDNIPVSKLKKNISFLRTILG